MPEITNIQQDNPKFTPVDYDPFAQDGAVSLEGKTLTPVDYDPFEEKTTSTPVEEEKPEKTQTKSALQTIDEGFSPMIGKSEGFNLGRVDQSSETHNYDPVANVIKNIPEEYKDRALNAITFAATHGITASEAFTLHDQFLEEYKKRYKEDFGSPSLWKKVKSSLTAGMGDVYTTFGNLGKRHSKKESGKTMAPIEAAVFDSLMDNYIDFGNRLKLSFIPPEDPSEFNPRKLLDVDYMATTGIRSVPFSLSLLPAGIVGAYAGHRGAVKLGLGEFGKLVMTSLFGAGVSRPMESAFEAQNAADEMKEKGGSQEEQDRVFDEVYKNNLLLTGVDAAEFATALFPMSKVLGRGTKRVLLQRIFAAGGSIAVTGAVGAGEERAQEVIISNAINPDNLVSFFDTGNPRLNEATGIGFVFGTGFGVAGNVWTSLTDTVTKTMPDKVRDIYESAYSNAVENGMDSKTAEITALDTLASTVEGKAHLDSVLDELKTKAEGKEVEIKSEITTEPKPTPSPEIETPISEQPSAPSLTTEEQVSKLDALAQSEEDLAALSDEELVSRIEAMQEEKAAIPEAQPVEEIKEEVKLPEVALKTIPADLEIEVPAIKGKTRVKTRKNARKAFADNEAQNEKYKALLDCVIRG